MYAKRRRIFLALHVSQQSVECQGGDGMEQEISVGVRSQTYNALLKIRACILMTG